MARTKILKENSITDIFATAGESGTFTINKTLVSDMSTSDAMYSQNQIAGYTTEGTTLPTNYSFKTCGQGYVAFTVENGQVFINQQYLKKSYNRIYGKLDLTDIDEIYLKFKSKSSHVTLPIGSQIAADTSPYIVSGLIPAANTSDLNVKIPSWVSGGQATTLSNSGGIIEQVINTKVMTGEHYLLVTNIESGDFMEDPNYDPDNESGPKTIGIYTVSAPELIAATGRVYNKPPAPAPSGITIEVNKNSPDFTEQIRQEFDAYSAAKCVAGIDSKITWVPSVDPDEAKTPLTLPAGLTRGDINKDGEITNVDLDLLKAHVAKTTLITDADSLWAAQISEKGQAAATEINDATVTLLTDYLAGTKQIALENKVTDKSWQVDVDNNLFYYVVEDTNIKENSSIDLYTDKLKNYVKGTVVANKFTIYVKVCPTAPIECCYRIIDDAKATVTRKDRLDTISYEILLTYDNHTYDTFLALPEGKNYLDIPYIKERFEEYGGTLEDFIMTLPLKINYSIIEGKPVCFVPTMSEEAQKAVTPPLFQYRQIIDVAIAAVDELGDKLDTSGKLLGSKIFYPGNHKPTAPLNVQMKQKRSVVTLKASGSTDADTRDSLVYYYKILVNKGFEDKNKLWKEAIPGGYSQTLEVDKWQYNSGRRLYYYDVNAPSATAFTSIHIVSEKLSKLGIFVDGVSHTGYFTIYAKSQPGSEIDFTYTLLTNSTNDVYLVEPSIPDGVPLYLDTFEIRYLDVQAKANDKKDVSDWSNVFSFIVFVDSLLGVRNVILADLQKSRTIWYAGDTPPEDTKLLWIDPQDAEGGLKRYDESTSSWIPVPVIWS